MVLNKMVDIQISPLDNGVPGDCYYDEGFFRVFDPEELVKTSIRKIKKIVIERIFSTDPYKIETHFDKKIYKELKKEFRYVFLKAPLEEMPLYINEKYNTDVIAQWRLKIGK